MMISILLIKSIQINKLCILFYLFSSKTHLLSEYHNIIVTLTFLKIFFELQNRPINGGQLKCSYTFYLEFYFHLLHIFLSNCLDLIKIIIKEKLLLLIYNLTYDIE